MDENVEKIREYVKEVFLESGSHGLDHVIRVTRLCEMIGEREDADMRVLIPAALLHDIARSLEETKGIPHEEEGARMAEEFLLRIQYDTSLIPDIAGAIRTHRYRSKRRPETLEAKILSDADKLDAMGATGIARTFMQSGEQHRDMRDSLEHIDDKLLKLYDLMYTNSAREIARDRHELLWRFAESLREELAVADSGEIKKE